MHPAPHSSRPQVTFNDLCEEVRRRIDQGVLDAQQSAIHTAGRLKDFLDTRLDLHNYRFSRTRYRDLFGILRNGLPKDVPIKGMTVADIGCGAWNPWSMSFLYLMLGAKRAYAFDMEPVVDRSRAAKALADLAAMMLTNPQKVVRDHPIQPSELLANIGAFNLARLEEGDERGIDTERLVYRVTGAENLPLVDGEADATISQACFEHVSDVDGVVAELARVTRRGGIGIHGIDSTDHRRYEDPGYDALDYLSLARDEEHFFLGLEGRAESGHWMNRIRPTQYPVIFARHGFEVVRFNPWLVREIDEARRATFVEPFRSMTLADLKIVSGEFILRRV